VEADQCREEKDCICVARGAEDSFAELKDGAEKRHEQVEAEIGCGGGKTQKVPMIVIPHYPIRSVPESYDPDNINSDMGEVTELPGSLWVDSYKNNAPKMQGALDTLRNYINDVYNTKVADKPFVCGPPIPGQQATMNTDEVHEASVKIRRFQILQQDCAKMRDQVPLLISPTSEKVSPVGQQFMSLKKKLNCYKPKDGDEMICAQLNCYTGHDDAVFRQHLHEFEAKMMACEPEPEDVNSPAGVLSPTSATNENAASGTGVIAGGESQIATNGGANAVTQKGLGLGGAALSVWLSNTALRVVDASKVTVASKKSTWQSFL
jgi:hypothetical protein